MTPNEYQQLAARTICPQDVVITRLNEHPTMVQLLHCVVGMMGELGELASNLEKALWYNQGFDLTNFSEELGDASWYIAEGASGVQQQLEDIFQRNISKLQKRYPEKYTDHHAAEEHRDREAEREILEQKQQAIEEYYTKVAEPVPLCPREDYSRTNEDDCVLITKALRSGWQLIGKDPKTIILRGDKSEGWDATWRLVKYDGELVRVPHWFRKRLLELEIEREESERRSAINKTGSQILSQTGQGFAEPPEEPEESVQQFLNTDLTYGVDLTYKGGLMTLQPSPTGFYCPNCLTSYSLEVTTGHFVPTYVDLTKVMFDTLEELAGKIIDSYVHSSKDVSRAHSELNSVKQKLYNEFTTAIQTGK